MLPCRSAKVLTKPSAPLVETSGTKSQHVFNDKNERTAQFMLLIVYLSILYAFSEFCLFLGTIEFSQNVFSEFTEFSNKKYYVL